MKNWDRLAISLLTVGVLLIAGCSKPPAEPAATGAGVPLAQVDFGRAPAATVQLTPPPEGNGPAPDLADVSFATPDVGYGVTLGGQIVSSADGGVTWEKLHEVPGGSFNQVETAGPRGAVAVGRTGCDAGGNCQGAPVLLRTPDGGSTWAAVELRLPEGMEPWVFPRLAFQFLSLDVGYAWPDIHENYGGYRITGPLVTRDGGKTWAPVSLPEGYGFARGVFFRTPDVGFVTVSALSGPDFRVLQTNDGGRTWHTLFQENEAPLYAVHFVTEQDGYVAGGMNPKTEQGPGQYVAATHDGGATWEVVMKDEGRASPYTVLNFVNPTEGWAAAGGCWSMGANGPCDGPLSYTTDGGRTWHKTEARATRIRSLGNRAWVLENGVLRRTDDGGATWNRLWRPDAVQVKHLQFLNPQVGYLATNLGSFKTADGGKTWAPYTMGNPAARTPEAVLFLSEQTALMPDANRLLRSEDGGKSWADVQGVLPRNAEGSFTALAPDGKGGLWLGNRRTDCPAKTDCPDLLLHSTDGGRTWETVPAVPAAHINGIVWADDRRGLLLTWGSKLLTTADGGKSWSEQAGAKELSIYQASYAGGADLLWAAGTVFTSLEQTPSVLLHSEDGGKTWTAWKGVEAQAIQFVSPTEGWVVGRAPGMDNGGALLHTTDGGRTWTQVWPNLPR